MKFSASDRKERQFGYLSRWFEFEISKKADSYRNLIVTTDPDKKTVVAQFKNNRTTAWSEFGLAFYYENDVWKPKWEWCYYRESNNYRLDRDNLKDCKKEKLTESPLMDEIKGFLNACPQLNQE